MTFQNETIDWEEYVSKHRMFISEEENTVTQCLFAIKFIGLLEGEMYGMEQTDSHQYTIDTVQNYYKKLYLNVFDYDWKINASMEKCNLTMPLEELESLNSVDEITGVLRSIFYHDTLQTWKKWQLS